MGWVNIRIYVIHASPYIRTMTSFACRPCSPPSVAMEQASYTKQVVNSEPASRSVASARAVHDSVSTLPPYSSVDDIRNDLVHDIKKADKTDFDNIAKYFLFQCLSDNKAGKLGQLQTVIESLQEGDNEDVDIKVQEVGRVLDSLYDESLKAVLAIANHQEVRNLLKN